MSKRQQWTIARSFLLLLLLLDITVVAGWLIFYFEHYQKIATVVAGIWSAVLSVLTLLRIKTKKSLSLSFFISLLPVRIIIVSYTILIFILSLFFSLWEFHFHFIRIEALTLEQGTSLEMVWSNKDTLRNENNGVWEFYAKRGDHVLWCQPQGYKAKSIHVAVRGLSLRKIVRISDFERQNGYLQISYSPPIVALAIFNENNKDVIEKKQGIGGKPILLEKPPGRYVIKAEAPKYIPQSVKANVNALDTTEITIRLSKSFGILQISTKPSEMKIILNGQFTEKLTPNNIRLSPGHYQLVLKKRLNENFGFYMKKTIKIKKFEHTKIDTELTAIELFELTIVPAETDVFYYMDGDPLGRLTQIITIHVFPGEHNLSKQSEGQIISKSFVLSQPRGTLVKF